MDPEKMQDIAMFIIFGSFIGAMFLPAIYSSWKKRGGGGAGGAAGA